MLWHQAVTRALLVTGSHKLLGVVLGIARSMAAEIMFQNDEGWDAPRDETPEHRYERMRRWVGELIR